MVIATAPLMCCVPPTPRPTPPTEAKGTFTLDPQSDANRQIFATPLRPMGPPPGGPPEILVIVPAWFATPVSRTVAIVEFDVTGTETVIGPN
jgi:hypothetical protein